MSRRQLLAGALGAGALHPRTGSEALASKRQIDTRVQELFGASITPVMITKHLVNTEPRQADHADPHRGGSRNRYLVRATNGDFRLHKLGDTAQDALGKTGPTHPSADAVGTEYRHLVAWYENEYVDS